MFERIESTLNRHASLVGIALVICGFLWRYFYSSNFYLNPDESLHYAVAAHDWHGWAGFYKNATRVVHPPLFIGILEGMLHFGRSEAVLRFVPIAAGAAFPWFVMLWVRWLASAAAALCAQLILTFSPTLIDLSTEVRAYTIAFLFLSMSLVMLEQALDTRGLRCLAWFHLSLYLAILSEYCVAWFVGALGVYTFLRLRKDPRPRSFLVAWIIGQCGALGIYVFLYRTHIAKFSYQGLQGLNTTYLQMNFPEPHENLIHFAVKGTFRQFKFLFELPALAWFGAIAFLFGLYRLGRSKSPLHATLLVLPFCFACLGAIFRLFPYGATRHTAILGIPAAAAIGVAVAAIVRGRVFPIIATALPVVLLWNILAPDSYLPLSRERRQLASMHEAVQFLGSELDPKSVIVTDDGTSYMLGYYLPCPPLGNHPIDKPYPMRQCAGLRIVSSPTFEFSGFTEVTDNLSEIQRTYHLDGPIWVVAGGFRIHVANPKSDSRPFGRTIAIFQPADLPRVSLTKTQGQSQK